MGARGSSYGRARWAILVAILLAAGSDGRYGPLQFAAEEILPAQGSVIVIFRDGMSIRQRDQILRGAGALHARHYQSIPASAAELPSSGVGDMLRANPDVASIVPDRINTIFLDEGENEIYRLPKKGGGGGPISQVVPEGVHRIGADPGTFSFTGLGVGVAVVDTGIDFAHPDLSPGDSCFSIATSSSNCSAISTPIDCQDEIALEGHGTHVSGIIAALNNSQDVVGVAPNATLYAVKVFAGSISAPDSSVICGLDWIKTNADLVNPHIRVVNMSLGRQGTLTDNPAFRMAVQALYNKGISIVAAAGKSQLIEVKNLVPAGYPEVMAVASTTVYDGYNDGSNGCNLIFHSFPTVPGDAASFFTGDGKFDPTTKIGITISAPGGRQENIVGDQTNCYQDLEGILSLALGGGTKRLSGTSMATPHLAGVLALMWNKANFFGTVLNPEDARSKVRLSSSRRGIAPLDTPSLGYTFDGEREGVLSAPGSLQ